MDSVESPVRTVDRWRTWDMSIHKTNNPRPTRIPATRSALGALAEALGAIFRVTWDYPQRTGDGRWYGAPR
jgi:hypothetical protein